MSVILEVVKILMKNKDEQPIKFHNEAHKKNYEKEMKARSDQKQPLDSKTMIEQIRKNSKD